MARGKLQDCTLGCGHKHYGPPTATNCEKYRASHSGTGAGGATSSRLASKSLLGNSGGGRSDRGKELDTQLPIDELLGVDMGGIEVTEDGIHRSDDSPLDQGSIGDADEYVATMTKGYNGWKAVSGFSGQHGYSGPLMHTSEVLEGGPEDYIRSHPGKYAVVSVCEEDEEFGDTDPVGWMLLKKETETPGPAESRGEPKVGTQAWNDRYDATEKARDRLGARKLAKGIDLGRHGHNDGNNWMNTAHSLLNKDVAQAIADEDYNGLRHKGSEVLSALSNHADDLEGSTARLQNDPRYAEYRKRGSGEETEKYRAIRHRLESDYGTSDPAQLIARQNQVLGYRRQVGKNFDVELRRMRRKEEDRRRGGMI